MVPMSSPRTWPWRLQPRVDTCPVAPLSEKIVAGIAVIVAIAFLVGRRSRRHVPR